MNVLHLIEEVFRQVPAVAPAGTRWEETQTVITTNGQHAVTVAACIHADGEREELFWCDDVPVERSVLLRLTCTETECPHAVQVRAQWLAVHYESPTKSPSGGLCPRPMVEETMVKVGGHLSVARSARFPCFTPCPNGAHPSLTIDKKGFDLFEEGVCVGGGVVETGGVKRPRLPTIRAAEAYVLARHLESLAALRAASESASSPGA